MSLTKMSGQQKADDVYEVPRISTGTHSHLRRLERLVYICLGFIVLLSCIAVAAVALAVVALGTAKDAKDSSEVSSSTPWQQQTLDPCSSAPCTNGGTCLPFPADNYTCVCGVSDFGKHCQESLKNTVFFVTFKEWQTTVSEFAIIPWNDVRFDPGNNYDKLTGTYTAPYNGYYQFSITLRTSEGRPYPYAQYVTLVEGKPVHHCWEHNSDGTHSQTSCSMILKLFTQERVQIQKHGNGVIESWQDNAYINSWFDGHMLFPL